MTIKFGINNINPDARISNGILEIFEKYEQHQDIHDDLAVCQGKIDNLVKLISHKHESKRSMNTLNLFLEDF